MQSKETYLVSVYITTYYHEAYIAQAIESVLCQKTDFSYEIVISDDASQDGTQAIVRQYAEKYDNIRYVFNEENLGLTKNVFQAKALCRGKYMVQLSGDDYWIDERKLQKQVDFLEAHPEYFGVATRLECRTNDSQTADFLLPDLKLCGRAYRLEDYLSGSNFPTNGFLYRNQIQEKYDFFSLMPRFSQYIDDETDCILYLMLGDIYILPDATVAYRRQIESDTGHNFNSIHRGMEKLRKSIDLLNGIHAYFGDEIDLLHRYKVTLGPELFKRYRFRTHEQFARIYKSIPTCYRKRHLLLLSILYIPQKAAEVLRRGKK